MSEQSRVRGRDEPDEKQANIMAAIRLFRVTLLEFGKCFETYLVELAGVWIGQPGS